MSWHLGRNDEDNGSFVMSWAERDGPPVSAPTHGVFGTTLISRIVEVSLNAKVDLDYPVSGLFWRMTCDAQEILDAPAQGS